MASGSAALGVRLSASLQRFAANEGGLAAIEAALTLPVALGLLGLITLGGQGFEVQRKVTLASHTITDLVCQSPLPTDGTNSSGATLNQSTLDYYLSLSALILYPNDGSGVTAEISELQLTGNGSPTATVVWSEAWPSGTATRPIGQVVSINSSIVGAGSSYLILGEVQYAFQPLGVNQTVTAMSLSDAMMMSPRAAAQITVNWGQ
jgi:Flp pilus assembly protein TadG